MLKRKAMKQLETWLETKTKQTLLVTGARQVGKTYLIRKFAKKHWQNVMEINFFENTEAREAIETANNSSELFMRITAFANAALVSGKTVIFLDEIQECKEVVTFIKFLKEKEEYDYILSGSILGTKLKGIRSVPVGFLNTVVMFPLDFEEFCWANGTTSQIIDAARNSFFESYKIDEYIHSKLLNLFHRYLICGGMPDAVNAFIDSDNIVAARTAQEAIVDQYRWGISKYAASRARGIRRIFDLMPSEISMQDKRFTVRDVEGDLHFDRYDNDFMWLEDANVALPTYNVREPRYPLATNAKIPKFKLFSSDVGILTYQCGMNVVRGILSSRPDINFGAIYENAVAQELKAHGYKLYYFKKRNIGEIDFVIQTQDGHVVPIEVKSGKGYKRHSALNNVLSTEKYCIEKAFVLYEDNVSKADKVVYLPIYMAAFI